MSKTYNKNKYFKTDTIHFYRNNEPYGLLSNMYPVNIEFEGIKAFHSEGLYQACKYPYNPEIQQEILNEKNSMKCKMIAKKYVNHIRQDWGMNYNDGIRIDCMWFALTVKYKNNEFRNMLNSVTKNIVEKSKKDDFWGTFEYDDHYLGCNVLGEMLMSLKNHDGNIYIPNVKDFILLGKHFN